MIREEYRILKLIHYIIICFVGVVLMVLIACGGDGGNNTPTGEISNYNSCINGCAGLSGIELAQCQLLCANLYGDYITNNNATYNTYEHLCNTSPDLRDIIAEVDDSGDTMQIKLSWPEDLDAAFYLILKNYKIYQSVKSNDSTIDNIYDDYISYSDPNVHELTTYCYSVRAMTYVNTAEMRNRLCMLWQTEIDCITTDSQ
ncbi:MAG: hypothetical protein ACMUIP_13090 [bacterium]